MGAFWKRVARERPAGDSVEAVRRRIQELRELVDKNNQVLELIAQAGEMLGGEYIFDRNSLVALAGQLEAATRSVVFNLNAITGSRYPELVGALQRADQAVRASLESRLYVPEADYVLPLSEIGEELADAVGEKMARLGALRKLEGCRVPDGFVVTGYACQGFLESAAIGEIVERWRGERAAGRGEDLARLSGDLRAKLERTRLPRELSRAIERATGALRKRARADAFAVRSSAMGEDGELSFAGLYESVLGVAQREVLSAYKQVVSSLFSERVMAYRERGGLDPAVGLMAVGCLAIIPARASGVVYTLDPNRPSRRVVLVTAARGLGRAVVEGSLAVDRFEVSREPPHEVLLRNVAEKTEMYAAGRAGGVERAPIPAEERSRPALSDAELERLVSTALSIERYTKGAQDIEWAIDPAGELFILQARPLRLAEGSPAGSRDLPGVKSRYSVLLSDRGSVACRGVGAGKVCVLLGGEDLEAIPPGMVLVARTSSPRLAAAVAQASAVITDIGTSTGHLAAVAREFRVPAIVDTGNATQLLRGAGEVTVDADENVVYLGCVRELLEDQLLRRETFADAPEFRLLRRMLRRIAPLNLKNPRSPDFLARNCRTYHDIIRFAHEKAMEELAEGHGLSPRAGGRSVRRLDLDVPLDLVVIDLGGGVADGEEPGPLRPGRIRSLPLRAVIEGLTTEGVWATGPADMDLDGFMSSMTRSQALTDEMALRPDPNVAIVSADYLNLSLRLGYHFNIVESIVSEARSDNYIYFRFTGGVTEMTRRARRAALLRTILAAHDFVVEGTADLVIARAKKIPYEATMERLRMAGRLIGFTRQLDILLRDDRAVDRYVNCFMEGRYFVGSGRDDDGPARRPETP